MTLLYTLQSQKNNLWCSWLKARKPGLLILNCFLVLSTHNLETRGAEDRMCNLGNEKRGVFVFPLSRLCVCASMCVFILVITFICFFFFTFPWLLPPAFNCFLLCAALTCVLFSCQCAVYVQSCLPVCPLWSLNASPLPLCFWFQFTLLVWIFVSSLEKKSLSFVFEPLWH